MILFPKGWTDANRGKEKPWDFICNKYPAVAKHLVPFEEKANARYDKGNYWWELRECKYYADFENTKILLPDISLRFNCMFDDSGGIYCINTAYIIPVADKYLLGILNSNIATFIYKSISAVYRGGYLRFWTQYLEQIPIPPKPSQDKISPLVTKMLELNKKLKEANVPDTKTMLQRQIEATDKEIDRLVYELYGLTADEIKIVEGE